MKYDDRGLTFIELIIAIAISSIIFGAAVLFLGSAQKNYNHTTAAVDLQAETQILTEQIGTWVMEGNRLENDGGKLVIWDIPREVTTTLPTGVTKDEKASRRVIWLGSGGGLYLEKQENIDDADNPPTVDTAAAETDVKNCVGEYVTGFTIDKIEQESVTITVTMEYLKQDYTVTNTFTIRNAAQ